MAVPIMIRLGQKIDILNKSPSVLAESGYCLTLLDNFIRRSNQPVDQQIHIHNLLKGENIMKAYTSEKAAELDGVDVTVKTGTIIFVTIGVPFSNIPIMQKVMVYVEPTIDTPVTAAKKLRKIVANNMLNHGWTTGINFIPEDLYYEIYGNVRNEIPFAMSFNSRYRKEHIDGRIAEGAAS